MNKKCCYNSEIVLILEIFDNCCTSRLIFTFQKCKKLARYWFSIERNSIESDKNGLVIVQ